MVSLIVSCLFFWLYVVVYRTVLETILPPEVPKPQTHSSSAKQIDPSTETPL